jgi:hypothetical protein
MKLETVAVSAQQEIRVTNMQGVVLINRKISGTRLSFIDCRALTSGIYLVQLFENDKLISSTKLSIY